MIVLRVFLLSLYMAKIPVDSRVINDFGTVLEHVPFLAVSPVINLRSSDN